MITEIYAAGEAADRGHHGRAAGRGDQRRRPQERGVHAAPCRRAWNIMLREARPGDAVLTIGAGSVGRVARPTGDAAGFERFRFRMRIKRQGDRGAAEGAGRRVAPRRVALGKNVARDRRHHGRIAVAPLRNDSRSDAPAGGAKISASFSGRRHKRADSRMASCRGWCCIFLPASPECASKAMPRTWMLRRIWAAWSRFARSAIWAAWKA